MRSVLARIFGGIALLLLTLIGIGILLPGEWRAEANTWVDAQPDSVYAAVAQVRSWPEWMPWPESGARFTGPSVGPGAAFHWNDEMYGTGSFSIEAAEPGRFLEYRVSVEDDAVFVRGRIELRPADGGTSIRWIEEGDAGWNPLVGFAALTQSDEQAAQLQETLDQLATHIEESGAH